MAATISELPLRPCTLPRSATASSKDLEVRITYLSAVLESYFGRG
ncbi:Hypothetical protein (plasmid) [Pseudomonas putida]|nr:Hypothetical protein [Pseudomonas putida]